MERKSGSKTGRGGETHQDMQTVPLTTNHGLGLSDNQNSLRPMPIGPTLLEDFALREKIFHFDHERIPERIVHARGSGAHGYFECTAPIPELTKAAPFQKRGIRVPVFARFSTVAGGAGSADTPRDVRGFAVKFYTEQGNWDLVGNNIPVFFIQDAIKFPDLVHSVKMEADRAFPQAASAHDTFWDFISLMPEATHMVMWTMSDRAIPRSLRMMQGFGVHTFRMVNSKGQGTLVKFHWRPKLGVQSLVWDEAMKIMGADSDYHRRDLWESIESGNFPEWELGIQIISQELADELPYDVLDATKLVPEEIAPLTIVGRMVLDRNPENFFAETEQVAFLPTNIIPGIDFTNDPLLQGRLFSYLDTQKSRLGTANFHQIPINAPKCPMHNFQRDGMMQFMVPKGRANYEPNSLNVVGEDPGPRARSETGFASFNAVDAANGYPGKFRERSPRFGDHYSQARLFYESQLDVEQSHIVSAFVFELSKVTLEHVRNRQVANLRIVSENLAARVAEGLGQPLPPASKPFQQPVDLGRSMKLSILASATPSLQGRRIAVLFDEGSPKSVLDAIENSIVAAGASVMFIAPRIGPLKLDKGTKAADGQLAGSPSCLFDAVCLVLSDEAALKFAKESAAVGFVSDAYIHLKAIGCSDSASPLLGKAGVSSDSGVTGLGDDFIAAAGQRHFDREPTGRNIMKPSGVSS